MTRAHLMLNAFTQTDHNATEVHRATCLAMATIVFRGNTVKNNGVASALADHLEFTLQTYEERLFSGWQLQVLIDGFQAAVPTHDLSIPADAGRTSRSHSLPSIAS